ncbi:MAG TPA: cellulase family glycosylhydrolase [Solirubrobacteraceae bacterium]
MRRVLLLVVLLAAVATPARAAGLPRLSVDRGGPRPAIVDADGREVLLRGINVQQLGDYFQADPAQRTTFPLAREDFAGIRRLGFDAVRLTMSWSALQPARGAFDAAYVARVREAVGWAEAEGLYVVLDMHQDAWGKAIATKPGEACPPGLAPAVGWDGAPEWATVTDGLSTCRAANTRELSPAVARAFDAFYLDRDGIQAELVATWGRLAREFGGDPGIAGYDLFNEPHPGTGVGVNEGAPLGRYYAAAIQAIRAGERAAPGGFAHPVFFEPSVLWSGAGTDTLPPPGFSADPQIVFAPHVYAESITLDRNAGLTAVSVEQGWENARRAAAAYGAPLWSGEWGWFGKPEDDLGKLERYAAQEDGSLAGGAWWVWRQACGDPHVVGYPGASGSLNRYDCPGDRPLGLAEPFVRVLSRAAPRFAPGRLERIASDHRTGAFAVAGRRGRGACEVEVWVPGAAPPSLSGENVTALGAARVPGGWLATGCAGEGRWALSGRAGTAAAAAPPSAKPPCRSRRRVTVALPIRRRVKLRRITVRVNGKRVRRLRGDRRRVRVDFRGRPKGRVVVRIVAQARGGRRYEERREYRLCVPGRR